MPKEFSHSETDKFMTELMLELQPIIEESLEEDMQSTAAVMINIARSLYLQVHGPEIAAMMFYRVADDLTLYTTDKKLF